MNTHITLATYNIHAGVGTDGRFVPERIVRVLQEVDADVFALQEVEHHLIGNIDLLDYLAAETGLTAIAGPTLLRETRHYGNAMLIKPPALDVDRIDLSLPGREPRGAIDAILDCNGLRLRVVATHLGLSPGERRKQVRQLISSFESHESSDISVLTGDLNEWFLWGRILRWLRAHFQPTPDLATFPSRFPVFALDHIWLTPVNRLDRIEVHASDLARIASDHLPLKAVIDISQA
jgi:endonuclease/exonuclease/phosphatase family metal-dependent hydrolase